MRSVIFCLFICSGFFVFFEVNAKTDEELLIDQLKILKLMNRPSQGSSSSDSSSSSSSDNDSSSETNASSSKDSDVLILFESEVKSEALSSFEESNCFSDAALKVLNKVEYQSNSRFVENYEFQFIEPQIYEQKGVWKSITLGSRPIVKQPIDLNYEFFPQPSLLNVAPNPVVEVRLKVIAAINEAEAVIKTLRECNALKTDTKKLLELENLTIQNSTNLNRELQKTIYKIQQVLYEPDGWFLSGSGKFVGINSNDDVALINKYINQFEREVYFWQNDRTNINEDILYDHRKLSPKFVPAQPYDEKWCKKIACEQYNIDLKFVINAQKDEELEEAQEIVAKYEQQIPRTKDGWLKASSEHSRYCTINSIYTKNFVAHSLAQLASQQESSVVESEINALNLDQKEDIAEALKILSSPYQETELFSESLISSDFVKTVKEAESRVEFDYNLKAFADIYKEPELKQLLEEAFKREQERAQETCPEAISLRDQCDRFLNKWVDEYRTIQNKVLTDDNVFRKYIILWCTELDVKTLELLQGILHPIKTVEGMMYGFKTIAKFVGRLDEIEFYLECNDFETARQKSKELSDKIDGVLNHFKQLSREDKFKVAVGLLYDLVITQKFIDKSLVLAGRLRTAAHEIRSVKKVEQLAQAAESSVALEKAAGIYEFGAKELEEAAKPVVTYTHYVETAALLNRQISELTSIEQVIIDLRVAFDQTRKGFAEFSNKYIKVPYKHIFVPEISPGRKGIIFTGFHHDYLNVLEKSGIVKITNKVMGKHGFYKADVLFNGKLFKDKTFFPPDWARKKIISKIYEAYDDFISKGALGKLTKDGKYIIRGITSEGIEIEMYFTKSAQITTAYPII